MGTSEHHSRTLRQVTWDGPGDVLAVASFDATLTLWREVADEDGEGLTWQCVGTVTGHENEVKSSAFSPSGEYLATCSRDKSVWIYEQDKADEYECSALLQSHSQDVKMVKWHPCQDVLFSCSYDDSVKIWAPDGDDWACKETLAAHTSTVWGLSFNSVGSRFVTCSDDKTIRIWAPAAGSTTPAVKNSADATTGNKSLGASVASALFLSPLFRAGARAVKADEETEAEQTTQFSSEDVAPTDASCPWTCSTTLQGHHTRAVYAVDWLPFEIPAVSGVSSSCIASACGDNRVRVFQPRDDDCGALESWICAADVEAHSGDVNGVAWFPSPLASGEAALLASCGDDGEVVLWRYRQA